jgi:hypothetical protein
MGIRASSGRNAIILPETVSRPFYPFIWYSPIPLAGVDEPEEHASLLLLLDLYEEKQFTAIRSYKRRLLIDYILHNSSQ